MVSRQLTDAEKLQQKVIAVGLDPKATTVWVGKISPLIEDETIRKLLQACGEVKSWARVETNGQYKSFGFCYFQSAEGALRSLRLLDGVRLGEQKLKLNVDANTTKYLEDYDRKIKDFLEKEKAECEKTGKILLPLPFTQRDEKRQNRERSY